MLSPTFSSSASFEGSWRQVNSLNGITPSDLYPTRETNISSLVFESISPSTSSPILNLLSSSFINCSWSSILFSSSCIVLITSLIIQSGVDAPAVIPIVLKFLLFIYSSGNSEAFSICIVFSQFLLAIW